MACFPRIKNNGNGPLSEEGESVKTTEDSELADSEFGEVLSPDIDGKSENDV